MIKDLKEILVTLYSEENLFSEVVCLFVFFFSFQVIAEDLFNQLSAGI